MFTKPCNYSHLLADSHVLLIRLLSKLPLAVRALQEIQYRHLGRRQRLLTPRTIEFRVIITVNVVRMSSAVDNAGFVGSDAGGALCLLHGRP